MAEGEISATRFEQWAGIGVTVVAPVTVLSALLFYFGYVSARSQYAYFGIDVDTIGLSTRDYIMRSPQPLLAPLLVLILVGAGFLILNNVIRRHITSAAENTAGGVNIADLEINQTHNIKRIQHMVRWSRLLGLGILSIGIAMIFSYAYIRDWAPYALVTPLLIAFGVGCTAYASSLLNLQQSPQRQRATATTGKVGQPSSVQPAGSVIARRTISVLACAVIGASIFWATATIAQWTGLGLAKYDARHLYNLPSVILDTKERLFLRDGPVIEETVLPQSEGQTFHYRYRGLRLLIESQSRMFLVPDEWSSSDSTLIVPLDGSVRVQFQFQNELP
jgi:hypothetical protein